MKKWIFIVLLVVTFISETVIVMAEGNEIYSRGEIISAVVAFVCLSLTAAFLIALRRN